MENSHRFAMDGVGASSSINFSIFTKIYITSSQTFTVPAGVNLLFFWMCGGGHGGYGDGGDTLYSGWGGNICQGCIPVTPGEQLNIVVGSTQGGDSSINNISTSADVYNGTVGGYYGNPSLLKFISVTGATFNDVSDRFCRGYCFLDGNVYCGNGWAVLLTGGDGTHSYWSTSFAGTTPGKGGMGACGAVSATTSGSIITTESDIIKATGYGTGGGYLAEDFLYYTIQGAYASNYTVNASSYTQPDSVSPRPGVVILGYQ